ncbi:MAG: HepT-like ribonuclease domain-containing protein [Flavobacteriales bacterium]
MSDTGNRAYLLDMQEFAGVVLAYVAGKTEQDFLADRQLRDAVAYNLQVVGEAAYKVADVFKASQPEVDWFKIAGLRHRIVHDDRRIDDETLWRITQKYVPPLVEQLRKILEAGVE